MSDQPPPQDPPGPGGPGQPPRDPSGPGQPGQSGEPPQYPPYPQQPPGGQPPGGQPPGGQPPGWGQGPQQPGGWDQPPQYPQYDAGPGGQEPYSAATAIGYGWNKFKQNAGPFVILALISVVLSGLLSGVGNAFTDSGVSDTDDLTSLGAGFSVVGMLFNLAAQVVSTLMTAALIRGALDAVEGQQVSLGSMFERWSPLHVLIAALLVSVATTVGIILCVLPGLAVIFFTWFTNFFIVDRGEGAISGIKSSLRFTADNIGQLLLLALLSILTLLLGLLACVVGLLVAYPVVVIAAAYTYRRLTGQPVAP